MMDSKLKLGLLKNILEQQMAEQMRMLETFSCHKVLALSNISATG
jgi:hypothetical protein